MQKKEVPMVPGGIGLGVAPNGDLVIVQQAVAGLNVDDAEALCIELAAHVVKSKGETDGTAWALALSARVVSEVTKRRTGGRLIVMPGGAK